MFPFHSPLLVIVTIPRRWLTASLRPRRRRRCPRATHASGLRQCHEKNATDSRWHSQAGGQLSPDVIPIRMAFCRLPRSSFSERAGSRDLLTSSVLGRVKESLSDQGPVQTFSSNVNLETESIRRSTSASLHFPCKQEIDVSLGGFSSGLRVGPGHAVFRATSRARQPKRTC